MKTYANVDIKIKGTHEEIIEAALFLKNHYEIDDFRVMDSKDKLFAYIEHSEQLGTDAGMRQLVNQLTAILPHVSLNAVGIWENQETKEYQDFFYKYKNEELYFQTSDVYGKEDIDEEMTYEEFCATFDIDPNDAQAITYEEFKELIGNEIYMSASAEFVDDND